MTILDDIEIVLKHEISICKKRIVELNDTLNEKDPDYDHDYKEATERQMRYYLGRKEGFEEALAIVKGGYDRS